MHIWPVVLVTLSCAGVAIGDSGVMRPDTEVEDDASIMRIVLKAYRFDKTMIDVNGLYLHLFSRLCLQEKKD